MKSTPILAVLLLSVAWPAWAGEGHDHGDAPAAMAGPALPRFTAVSELFELVGVLDGTRLTLYLDRGTDNSPVKDAKLELELGGVKVPVEAHGEGLFEATLSAVPAPGEIPIAAAVIAGDETDLLAGELDVHEMEDEGGGGAHVHGWKEYAYWLAAAVLGLVGLAWLIRRLRTQRIGGVA
ncbi:MAG: hypothetical protein LT080_10695 [Thiobacillus sp.]|nr:hypothetical protein [Thiobacillus sp.]